MQLCKKIFLIFLMTGAFCVGQARSKDLDKNGRKDLLISVNMGPIQVMKNDWVRRFTGKFPVDFIKNDWSNFELRINGNTTSSELLWKTSEQAWKISSESDAVPIHFDMESIKIGGLDGGLSVVFNYGVEREKCNIFINDKPLSYGILYLNLDGSYRFSYHMINGSCQIEEMPYELAPVRKMTSVE